MQSPTGWYLAEIVETISVAGEANVLMHTNLVLVQASSPEEAYDRAQALGSAGDISYLNPEGKTVTIAFHGLHELGVIHDPFEHGAEIAYEEPEWVDETAVAAWVRPKDQLAVFRPRAPRTNPNYMSADVLSRVRRLMEGEEPEPGGFPGCCGDKSGPLP